MLKGIYVTYTNYYKALENEKEEICMKNWVQFRIARPTDKFEEVISFYETGLGLKRIGNFTIMKDMMGLCLAYQMKSIIWSLLHMLMEVHVRHRQKIIY